MIQFFLLLSVCSTSSSLVEIDRESFEFDEKSFAYFGEESLEVKNLQPLAIFPDFVKNPAPLLEGYYVHKNFLIEIPSKSPKFCPFQHLNAFKTNLLQLLDSPQKPLSESLHSVSEDNEMVSQASEASKDVHEENDASKEEINDALKEEMNDDSKEEMNDDLEEEINDDSDTLNESWQLKGMTTPTASSTRKKPNRSQESRAPFLYSVSCCGVTFTYIASAIKHIHACSIVDEFNLSPIQATKQLIECIDFRDQIDKFPIICTLCPYRCKSDSLLKSHLKKIHLQ